jgi:hypothetical protein
MDKTNKTTGNQPSKERCKRSSAGEYSTGSVTWKTK